MILGFTTGVLAQQMDTKKAIQIMRQIDCRVVELGFNRKSRLEEGWLKDLEKDDLDNFDYLSFHAPGIKYQDNEETHNFLESLKKIHKLRPLDLVVFHPNSVVDVMVLKNLPFPVALENMADIKNPFGKTPEDLDKLLRVDDSFRLVLDLNHIKANDPSMKLAEDFYEKFGDRIAEYHVSGLGQDWPHIPLFQTKEKEILGAIRDKSIPIICESRLRPEEIKKEKEYIEETIG